MTENECSCDGCNLDVFENDKCIFHCEKGDWITKNDPSDNKRNLDIEIKHFWDEEKVKSFWNKFKNLIEDETNLSEEEIFYRFNGFIFPKMEQNIFENYEINCSLVFDKMCTFEDNIDFFNTKFKGEVYFNNCQIKGDVSFTKSTFSDRFSFNNIKEIKKVSFRFAKFEKKFEFKNSECKSIDLYNAVFKNLADFFQSKFENCIFEKTDFEKISVFSECEFNSDVDFKHTKFLGKAFFMDAVIKKKLNLRKTIFVDEANFLDISGHLRDKVNDEFVGEPSEIKVANRETARIIKNFYDNTNNIIEANRFYKLEMKEREKELSWSKGFFEKLVFTLHGISSEHSQNGLLALFWILILSMGCAFIQNQVKIEYMHPIWASIFGYTFLVISIPLIIDNILENQNLKKYTLSSVFLMIGFYVLSTKDLLLELPAKAINPFSIMQNESHINGLELIFKVIIAYLIYQLIISIRQNTRRK